MEMKKLTYKEAYDKIIEAYFKDEIEPLDPKFCFCGTLCNNDATWFGNSLSIQGRITNFDYRDFNGYTKEQFVEMEAALLKHTSFLRYDDIDYENALFNGMCAALDVLKQIHKERGEDVDGVQEFTKRRLNSEPTAQECDATKAQ